MRWPATEPAAVRWCGFRTRSFFTTPSADPPPRPSPARGEGDLVPLPRPSPPRGEGDAGGGSFTIFNRPDISIALSTLYELGFSPARTRLVHLDTPAIAAHQVRDRLRRGAPIDDLVPPPVAEYIQAHRLYQA